MSNTPSLRRLASTLCMAASLAVGVTGCKQSVDLAAVQQMAKQTAASKSAFDAISADFYDSCVRAKGFEYAADPTAIQDVASLCAKNQKASQLWQAANEVLLTYVAALDSLATDKTSDYGLNDLASSIDEAHHSHFSDDQRNAIASAAEGLMNATFAARRRNALAAVMQQAQAPDPQAGCPHGCLNDLIESLERIAREQYAVQLSAEDTAVYAFYQPNISAGLRIKGIPALTAFGYEIEESKARQAVAARRASIATYVDALDQIEKTHGDVTDAVASNKPEEAIGVVSAFAATYSAKITALEKAFH